jgi:UDP-N-acetylglucosamine acyltransferase
VGRIDSSARVADGARLGADVEIGPYTVIGPAVEIGDGCRIGPLVSIAGCTRIGPRTQIFPFASLGAPPQSVHYRGGPTRLVIGADCIIREHVTAHTGTEDGGMETTVGDRCFIMAGAHVAHDCKIGDDVLLVNNVILGGHCEVGQHAVLSGGVTLHPFVRIGEYAILGGMTGSVQDILPFSAVWGAPPHLRGVNAVGLKRRGFAMATIQTLRKAFQALSDDHGPAKQRAERLAQAFPGVAEVMRIVDFIRRGGKRPFLLGIDPDPGESGV